MPLPPTPNARGTRLRFVLGYALQSLELELFRPLPLSWFCRWIRFRAWVHHTARYRFRTGKSVRVEREQITNEFLSNYLREFLMTREASRYPSLLTVEGWEHVEAGLAAGQGVVLLTCHVGMPEITRWHLRTREVPACHVYKMSLPRKPGNLWERLLLHRRTRFHCDEASLIGGEDLSAVYMKQAHDCLRKNGLVNIAGDGGAGDRRIPVTIAGRPHSLPAGGMALGLLAGAPILPSFTVIERGPHFRMQIEPPLPVPEGLPRNESLGALVQAYAERIERHVRKHPNNAARLYVNPAAASPATEAG